MIDIKGTYDIVPDIPVLEKIIIDVTNSSLSEVEIQTDTAPLHGRDDPRRHLGVKIQSRYGQETIKIQTDTTPLHGRDNPGRLLGIKIQPRDKSHENFVISKMNYTETEDCSLGFCNSSFTDEMNLMLQNETTKNNLTVKGMAPIWRSTPYGNS